MKSVLVVLTLWVAVPALAQIRATPEAHLLRNAPPGTEEETAVPPPVNLRPTQLLRCPDGNGGITLQDTPCKPATATPGVTPAFAPEVIDLSQLQPRPQAEARAPRVDDGASSRRIKGMLYGAGKLALLLVAMYAVYRIGRYARDRPGALRPAEMPSRCRAGFADRPAPRLSAVAPASQVQVQRAHVDVVHLLQRHERHHRADAAAVGTLAGLEHRHELLGVRIAARSRCPRPGRGAPRPASRAARRRSCRRSGRRRWQPMQPFAT